MRGIKWLWAAAKAKLSFCLLLWPETQPALSPGLPTALFGVSVGRSAKKKGRKEHFLSVLCESIYIPFPSSTQGPPGVGYHYPHRPAEESQGSQGLTVRAAVLLGVGW